MVAIVAFTIAITGLITFRQFVSSKKRGVLVNWKVVVPYYLNKSPEAVVDLMTALAEAVRPKRILSQLFSYRQPDLVLRIKANQPEGIQFIVSLPKQCSQAGRRLLEAHLPESQIDEYPPILRTEGKTSDLKLKTNQALTSPKQQDPIGFLTTTVSQMEGEEAINYQILLKSIKRQNSGASVNRLLSRLCQIVLELNSNHNYRVEKPKGVPTEAIFKGRISLNIAAEESRLVELRSALIGSLGLIGPRPKLSVSGLLFRKSIPTKLNQFNNQKLTSTQIADIYHWPNSQSTTIDDLDLKLTKTLPRPNSLKNEGEWQIVIGDNHHRRSIKPIGLTAEDRQRHMFVIGGTGVGKSEFLKYQIIQDIEAGRGLAVIDPHGDLAIDLINYVPPARHKDLIYLNPSELDRKLRINLLEIDRNLTGNDWLVEADLVTESALSTIKKIFNEGGGHRIEYILRNTIQTALSLDEANLFTIYRLLNDKVFRKQVSTNVDNPDLKLFWQQEIGHAGAFQRVKMSAGVTAKIGRFLFSPIIKQIFDTEKSSFNFDQLIDQNKILICNFAKGLIGEDGSQLLGTTVLAKLQLAALRRVRQNRQNRQPFHLYVDEFQNFANQSFVEMLSESRKYQLLLTIAEQSTQQQDNRQLIEVILANVGTIVSFRSGSPADADLLSEIFRPFVDSINLTNLPAYNFYAKIISRQPKDVVSGVVRLAPPKHNKL